MITPSAKVTYNGRPVDVLCDLVQKRARQLGTTVQDAVRAAAINVLKSVRASTLVARRGRTVVHIQDTGMYGSFDADERKPCIRTGPFRRSPKAKVVGNVKWLPAAAGVVRHVYAVQDEHTRKYYVVAATQQEAEKFAKARANHRIERFGGLARNVSGVAMYKLSTRNPPPTGHTRAIAESNLAKVHISGDGSDVCGVYVQLGIDYATEAIRGGNAAIDDAIKKASNKIYGQLQHLGGIDISDEYPSAPFPEVARRR